MIKKCKICNKSFILNSNVQKYCSPECFKRARKEAHKLWMQNNKNKTKIHNKNYRKKNKIKLIKRAKKYYRNNKITLLTKMKIYREQHREELKQKKKEHYQTHKEENIINCRNWRLNHKEQRNKYMRKYKKEHFSIVDKIRHRIYMALKGNYKNKTTIKLLGCSVDFLKKYLQMQFKSEMNWNNYGKWHIDHIKPCASFDLSKPNEQLQCFNYREFTAIVGK